MSEIDYEKLAEIGKYFLLYFKWLLCRVTGDLIEHLE